MMEKRKARTRFQKRRTLRLSAGEDEKLTRQAATAGISVSEYMRRLFFGGRPIIARTDDQTIRELRRLGGATQASFYGHSGSGKSGKHGRSESDAPVNPADH